MMGARHTLESAVAKIEEQTKKSKYTFKNMFGDETTVSVTKPIREACHFGLERYMVMVSKNPRETFFIHFYRSGELISLSKACSVTGISLRTHHPILFGEVKTLVEKIVQDSIKKI